MKVNDLLRKKTQLLLYDSHTAIRIVNVDLVLTKRRRSAG